MAELAKTFIDLGSNNRINGPGTTQEEQVRFYTDLVTRQFSNIIPKAKGLNAFSKTIEDIYRKVIRSVVQLGVEEYFKQQKRASDIKGNTENAKE